MNHSTKLKNMNKLHQFKQKSQLITCLLSILLIFGIRVNALTQIETNGTSYLIQNKVSEKVLDVKGGSNDPNTTIWQFDLNLTTAQSFTFENAGDGLYYIKSSPDRYVTLFYNLVTSDGSTTNETSSGITNNFLLIQDKKYEGSESPISSPIIQGPRHQKWRLVPVPNEENMFVIQSAVFSSAQVLQPLDNLSKSRILLAAGNNMENQKWRMKQIGHENQIVSKSHQWRIDIPSSSNNIALADGVDFSLKNMTLSSYGYVAYKKRLWGINLGWFETAANTGYPFQIKHDRESGVLKYGDMVAIHVRRGGWLKFKNRIFGVNLGWSDTPVYRWKVSGNTAGKYVLDGDKVALVYNLNPGVDSIIYCKQTVGINLQWSKDCIPPSTTDPTPNPPSTGVSRILVYNCHSEKKSVRVWTYDITNNPGNLWADRGVLPSQWSSSSGCPEGLPLQISLEDGHSYILKAIDCGSNPPNNTDGICHKLTSVNAIPGKTGGITINFTVQ
jgi:hypothetical protein